MNGVHDLGGMHGFGPVLTEENEPVFHHDWERSIFPLFASLFVGGHFNVDEFRHSIERMEPAEYLQSSYYEHWLHAFETLLLEKGVISAAELQGTVKPTSLAQPPTVLTPDIVEAVILGGASSRAKEPVGGRFQVGDRVRTKNLNPITHTRLPRYARGKVGTIEIAHGAFATPDTMAHGLGEQPQQVYAVRFSATELWGVARPDSVCIDLWDNYLEAV
ncbi:nitrile hydratase subunit beta [Pseudomonas chlororaphis]|uniref:nitrile hydratase subunit beta n=1 Tax=Pseudomonas chlororaphis TaxID=587753 RepID=UPI000E0A1D46|nr:nitrile hydratase subunit beta [Pseudomonas chlororaphis]AZD16171.1 Cobalt-containing nitrile hydratase subunit beta [Pseudomonas chlororaphis]WDH44837.1 nitrile hydratase subunit beta [Pseudomonas chlororaphis]WDH56684.1 nitrile hydratase subunit beta [Pseudomonas chlororaphis]WQE15942.1 nitrile hydratase subunit beta [Pseudomonas chlororaphis]